MLNQIDLIHRTCSPCYLKGHRFYFCLALLTRTKKELVSLANTGVQTIDLNPRQILNIVLCQKLLIQVLNLVVLTILQTYCQGKYSSSLPAFININKPVNNETLVTMLNEIYRSIPFCRNLRSQVYVLSQISSKNI